MASKYIKNKRGVRKSSPSKINVISVNSQFIRLKKSFPNLVQEECTKSRFSVVLRLQTDVFSREYDVRIVYEHGKSVNVFIVNEVLRIATNRTKLPHVYDSKLQRICLYGREGGSWSSDKSIASVIVPWVSEWLFYYELWLIDGQWYGGGHNEYENENIAKDE